MSILLDPVRAMMAGLIDYAGLFPPALLGLAESVDDYRKARSGPHGWILGAYVCSASQLADLANVLTRSMVSAEAPWSVSALVRVDTSDLADAQSFDAEMAPAARVGMIETRLPDSADGGEAVHTTMASVAALRSDVALFIEFEDVGRGADPSPAVDAIGEATVRGRRPVGAKLRCGGATPEASPSAETVARFISACVTRRVPFKMTAGLHHAVRHHDPARGITEHGFLNLIAATAFAEHGGTVEVVQSVIEETDPAAFHVGATGLRWRDLTLVAGALRRARERGLVSIGSCSFDEPIAELEHLGLIERFALS